MRYVECNDGYVLNQNTIYALGGNPGTGLIMNASITTSYIGDILGNGITLSLNITSEFYLKANSILLGGQSGKTISMERHQTANNNGNSLTLVAGGATVGATDKNGGNNIIESGIATGTGSSNIIFKTATPGASGTSDRIPSEKLRLTGDGVLKLMALNTAPGSATATGTIGEIRFTNGYIYLCIATNTWIRCQLLSW